jgi:GH24 family phage-related lysozyme (muramidase)
VVMPQYRMAGGKVRKGLEIRRKWEVSLWLDKTL